MKKIILTSIILNLIFIINAHNTGNIEGYIKDAENQTSIPGANIIIEGSIIGTTSNINGYYNLKNIQIGNYKISYSFLGYKKITKEITIKENETIRIDLSFEKEIENIKEIIIEGNKSFSTASSKEIRKIDIQLRPANTAHDMLMLTPGIVIAQHAGGGKAEQIYIRGFDCDHGTDIAISVDGMPVNMVSHGHGQGYADLHFLMPILVDELEVNKGPYFAVHGDFSTAGAISFKTKDILNNNLFSFERGDFNTNKTTFAYQPENGGNEQNGYIAGEYYTTDGPFESKQKFGRYNIFGKYFTQLSHNSIISLSVDAFSSVWDASGQIPQRAIKNGFINRFGAIDNLEGGTTGRQNINLTYKLKSHQGDLLKIQTYLSQYDFRLFSNFTMYLNDSLNGDMIEQTDNRIIYGNNINYKFNKKYNKVLLINEIGGGFRADNIENGLWHSPERIRKSEKLHSKIFQRNIYAFLEKQIVFSSKFRIISGLRSDYFTYNVYDIDSLNISGVSQQNILNPKLNFVYKPYSNLNVFLNSGTGFHSNDARDAIQKTNSLPRVYGIETGSRYKFNNSLHFGVALWYLYMNKEFVFVGDEGVVELSNPTQRKGIEFETRLKLIHWLWIDFDFSYSHGEITNLKDGENYIPLAPNLTSTGGINIIHPNGIEGTIRYRYVGDRPANEDNSVVALGYKLFNASISYKINKIKLSGQIENIFNIDWNEAQFDTETKLQNETNSVSELCFTPGNPRNIRIGISYIF